MDRKNCILGNRRDKWSQITKMNRQCNTKCEKQICIQKLFPLWSTLYSQHFCKLLRGGLGVDIWHDATVCGLWGFVQRMSRKCLILIYQPTWFSQVQVLKFWYRTTGYGNGIRAEWVRNVCRYGYGLILRNSWRERNGNGLISKSWCGDGTGK